MATYNWDGSPAHEKPPKPEWSLDFFLVSIACSGDIIVHTKAFLPLIWFCARYGTAVAIGVAGVILYQGYDAARTPPPASISLVFSDSAAFAGAQSATVALSGRVVPENSGLESLFSDYLYAAYPELPEKIRSVSVDDQGLVRFAVGHGRFTPRVVARIDCSAVITELQRQLHEHAEQHKT